MKNCVKILVFLCVAAQARAAGEGFSAAILSANAGIYNTKSSTDGTQDANTQVTNLDATLGYLFSSGIYIGGIYGSNTTKIQGAATKPEMKHYGASLGYMVSGWIFHAHYLTSAEIKNATMTANRVDGSGTQFDVGYVMHALGPIFIGAHVSQRTIEYKKLDTNGVKTDSKHKVSDLFPAIRLTIIW